MKKLLLFAVLLGIAPLTFGQTPYSPLISNSGGGGAGGGSSSGGTINPGAQYDIAYYSVAGTTNTLSGLAAGTANYVLQSGGSSAAASWTGAPTILGTNITAIPGANIENNTITNTQISTGSFPAITGVGTLTSLTVNGIASISSTTFNGVAYTWPAGQGSASTVLTNNGSGALTWASSGSGGSSFYTLDSSTTISNTTSGTLTLTSSTYNSWKLHFQGAMGSTGGTMNLTMNSDTTSGHYAWILMFLSAANGTSNQTSGSTGNSSNMQLTQSTDLRSNADFLVDATLYLNPQSDAFGSSGNARITGTVSYFDSSGDVIFGGYFSGTYNTAAVTTLTMTSNNNFTGAMTAVGFNE